MELKSLVILGGGFGGLSAAKILAKKTRGRYRVILIDRNPTQTFTPTLPELEINGVDLKKAAQKYGFEFQVNEILGLDTENKIVRLADKNISADGLILALGSSTEYFGIPGLEKNSLILKSGWDVEKILATLKQTANPKILIAGGGPTGTELAGTLSNKGQVTLIEKSADILPGFSENFRVRIKNKLIKKGVKIITNCGILEAKPGAAILEISGEEKCDLLVWAGGARGPTAYSDSGLATDTRGRLITEENLKVTDGIFAIGDGAAIKNNKSGGARAAIMQGRLAAQNLLADLENKPIRKYNNRRYPYLLPLGNFWAAMEVGGKIFSGFWVYLLKRLINWQYLKLEA